MPPHPSRAPWAGPLLLAAAVLALILVPFALAGERMDAWSVSQVQALAERRALLAALVVALLAADVVLPVPSSIVATLAGAALGFAAGAAATLTGMTAGCAVAYAIGRWARTPVVGRLVTPGQAARLHALARRHGGWALALARPVPVLAEASTLLAGAAALPFGRFMAVTTAANLGIAAAYAAVGAWAADARSFLLAFAGAVAVPLAGKALLHLLSRPAPPA